MSELIHIHRFDNGLTVVGQEMDWLESVAFTLMLPAGAVCDPRDRLGLANFACEMVQRGCGDLDSQQFLTALENLGVDYHAGVSTPHTTFAAATLADSLLPALELFAKMLREPRLPEEAIEEARLVCLQELRALADDPPQQLFQELRARQFADPWGRSQYGCFDDIQRIDLRDVQGYVESAYSPAGVILSVAGQFRWPLLLDKLGELFGDWRGAAQPMGDERLHPPGHWHVPNETDQTHLAIAFPTIPYRDERHYQAWAAANILGGGMSSRLFTEVRENRGLCYSVSASYASLREFGTIRCYSGVRVERAQEALDVILAELARFSFGIEADELTRIQARIKTALIMQQESSRGRSSSLATDLYFLGRAQPLAEVHAAIDALTPASINAFLAEHPPREFTIVTLGPEPLDMPDVVSSPHA